MNVPFERVYHYDNKAIACKNIISLNEKDAVHTIECKEENSVRLYKFYAPLETCICIEDRFKN